MSTERSQQLRGQSDRIESWLAGSMTYDAIFIEAQEVLISPEIHQRTWNAVEAQQISIPTKHEGDLVAYRVDRLRDRR